MTREQLKRMLDEAGTGHMSNESVQIALGSGASGSASSGAQPKSTAEPKHPIEGRRGEFASLSPAYTAAREYAFRRGNIGKMGPRGPQQPDGPPPSELHTRESLHQIGGGFSGHRLEILKNIILGHSDGQPSFEVFSGGLAFPWGHNQKPPYETNAGRTWDQFRKMSDSDKRGSDFHVAFDCYDDDHMIVINCLDYDFDELCDRGEVHIGSNQKLIDKASVSSCFTNYGIPCKYFRK